jgi:hypothetical protein
VAFTTFDGVDPFAGFVHSALIVAEPVFTPLARPYGSFVHTWTGGVALLKVQVCVGARVVLIVATDGILELHVSCDEFVTSSIRPEVPYVARAINWPDWPEADSDSEPGVMDSAVTARDPPPLVTVKVAVPATTVSEAGLVYRAVTVTVPWLIAVACPGTVPTFSGLPTEPIDVLLELQVDWPVRLKVAPDEFVPMAMNWLVFPGETTD